MSLSTKIGHDLLEQDEGPEEIEHALIKDSVLEMVNTYFKLDDDFGELPMGEIRRNVAQDLPSEYEGKPVSRKSFSQRNWIDETAENYDEASEASGDDSDEEVEDKEMLSDQESGGEEEESDDQSNADEEGADSQISDASHDSEKESSTEKLEKISDVMDIDIFSSKAKNVQDDIRKGNDIKNQLLLWENLIECRIKLQKGLAASNRMLQKEQFAEFKSQLTPEEDLLVNNAQKSLIDLLETFITLKEYMLKKCPEYVKFKQSDNTENAVSNDDEEITSSESENEKEDSNKTIIDDCSPNKKRKMCDDYSEFLSSSTDNYKPFRDSVIQKWNDKTRLASGKIGISKFAILEQSTLKQIEQILLDKDRLLKRTQTRRSKIPVLGKSVTIEKNDKDPEDETVEKAAVEEALDSEIFDDDDFYHKLLKDFIDRKTSDITDPNQLGRQWTKLQKLRSKMKRKVDTRASKGRKIRYTVHNKIVNFMAPVPYCTWEEKVQQDLFRSLFGQASVPATST